MKMSEVVIGSVYLVNHTSGRVPVRILREIIRGGYTGNQRTHLIGLNLKTKREIELKSAGKLIRLLDNEEIFRYTT